MCEMVIKSSTEESQLSLAENMSVEEMPPDYFVSHWWGVCHSPTMLSVCLSLAVCVALLLWSATCLSPCLSRCCLFVCSGESTLQFLGCIFQHSKDRMLCCEKTIDGYDNKDYLGEDRSPRYWICA